MFVFDASLYPLGSEKSPAAVSLSQHEGGVTSLARAAVRLGSGLVETLVVVRVHAKPRSLPRPPVAGDGQRRSSATG